MGDIRDKLKKMKHMKVLSIWSVEEYSSEPNVGNIKEHKALLYNTDQGLGLNLYLIKHRNGEFSLEKTTFAYHLSYASAANRVLELIAKRQKALNENKERLAETLNGIQRGAGRL